MFGGSSSPPKEKVDTLSNPSASLGASPTEAEDGSAAREKSNNSSSLPSTRKPSDGANTTPALEKKRRSSSVAKAANFFTNAKNSLHLSSSPRGSTNIQPVLTPLQKLSKMDPALGVPQGSLNNSAGESMPTPRSSFRVGVTEDKNRKCRRTMEDTHAYLYNFLGTPVPTSALSSSNGNESSHSVVSSGSEESTHVVETDNGYFAIFDGHAGTFAAEWCGKKLHIILEEIMRKHPNTPVPELLDQTFTSVDQQLEKLPLKNSGCTAVTAVLRWEDRIPSTVSATGSSNIAPAATVEKPETDGESPNTPTQASTQGTDAETSAPPPPTLKEKANRQRVLYTANVGDARVVLCRSGKALRLSYDHKGSDDNEGKRIMSAGGLILNNRVNGVLAVTRALGDTYLKDLVTGHPYTTETVIQPDVDEFLILACDGLWDVCSDQEAVDLVRNIQDPQVASKVLVDHALARFSTDNLSCMIVRLDSKLIQSMVEHLVEPIGVEGDPLTKKKGGVSEADKIVSEARKSIGSSPDDENPLENSKLHEEMEQQASNEELGPEVTPGEVHRLPDVAELDVQNKAKIKDDDKGPDIAGDKEK